LVPRRIARVEPDGVIHRRDCECARCDAGFVPSEAERRAARVHQTARRGGHGWRADRAGNDLGRARAAAARARERRRERDRLRQLDLQAFFERTNAATDAEIARLRVLRARSLEDRRLDQLLGLRNAGLSLDAAIAEVDRVTRLARASRPGNDNGFARTDDAGDDAADGNGEVARGGVGERGPEAADGRPRTGATEGDPAASPEVAAERQAAESSDGDPARPSNPRLWAQQGLNLRPED
jgi:hypothetical protein